MSLDSVISEQNTQQKPSSSKGASNGQPPEKPKTCLARLHYDKSRELRRRESAISEILDYFLDESDVIWDEDDDEDTSDEWLMSGALPIDPAEASDASGSDIQQSDSPKTISSGESELSGDDWAGLVGSEESDNSDNHSNDSNSHLDDGGSLFDISLLDTSLSDGSLLDDGSLFDGSLCNDGNSHLDDDGSLFDGSLSNDGNSHFNDGDSHFDNGDDGHFDDEDGSSCTYSNSGGSSYVNEDSHSDSEDSRDGGSRNQSPEGQETVDGEAPGEGDKDSDYDGSKLGDDESPATVGASDTQGEDHTSQANDSRRSTESSVSKSSVPTSPTP